MRIKLDENLPAGLVEVLGTPSDSWLLKIWISPTCGGLLRAHITESCSSVYQILGAVT